ncbi:S41 family peptidase [Balneola sp. MJW-20]|uniref:S41 family peptidase n=1 Tax=Gracilimonas aurantiaca TaxID=3234185 RepID=UPI003466A3D6
MNISLNKKYSILILLLTITWADIAAQQSDVYFLIKKNFSIFSKTYENVALDYVDEVDPEILMRNGLNAMLETLDPYTVLFSEAQNEEAEIRSGSNFAGIGVELGFRDGNVVVVAPLEGGPAEESGIRAGDIIISVDGVPAEDLQPEEVLDLTIGEAGSELTLTIQRFGSEDPLDLILTRRRTEVRNVSFAGLVPGNEDIAYLRLNQFGIGSAEEIRERLVGFNEQSGIKGMILDLRDNPGGVVQEAVSIVDKFVEPGITVVETRGRKAEYNAFYTSREPVLFNKPLVILMNGGSASASEVVAGAIQDLDRGVILGEQSFGKGLVQVVKPLPYNTSMKVTIARYYTPSGRSIQSINYTHQGNNSGVVKTGVGSGIYKTRNGRSVSEGRGIEPDIELKSDMPSLLEIALIQNGAFFNYATRFESENDSYEASELSQEIYDEFLSYLSDSGFSFKTESQKLLDELKEKIQDLEGADERISAFEELIEEEKQSMFIKQQAKIKRRLFLELVSRFDGATGRTEKSLIIDPQVNEAISLINDPDRIDQILSGS